MLPRSERIFLGERALMPRCCSAAHTHSQAAYMMFGYKVEAQLSAANMALKLGEV